MMMICIVSVLLHRSAGIKIGMDIYIVRNGAVIPYLREDGSHRNAQLPVLPPEVTRIEVKWMAEDDLVSYYATNVRLSVCPWNWGNNR